MQLAQVGRALRLLLVIGLASAVVGCGAGGQAPPAAGGPAPTPKGAQIKNFIKNQLKGAGGEPKGGRARRNNISPKSGP